jgi:hypothetical protein
MADVASLETYINQSWIAGTTSAGSAELNRATVNGSTVRPNVHIICFQASGFCERRSSS